MNRRTFLRLAGVSAVMLPLTARLGWAPAEAEPLAPYDATGPKPEPMQVPPGSIHPFAGQEVPEGWLLCDGQAVSVFKYPKLAKVIEGVYGREGTKFRVPNMSAHPVLQQDLTESGLVYLIKAV